MDFTLRTIGYEGASLEGLIAALQRARVSLLIDVRAVAVSRRKGFSKTALATSLRDSGIGYLHLRSLGDPKPGREAARAGRFAEFRTIYKAHLRSAVGQAALAEAARAVGHHASCLLCYETEPTDCHRFIVATAIAREIGIAVQHLYPDPPHVAA